MKQADAKNAIIQEWLVWRAANLPSGSEASGNAALLFYGHLTSRRPDLLAFRGAGDKWQHVHAWLLRSGLVKN